MTMFEDQIDVLMRLITNDYFGSHQNYSQRQYRGLQLFTAKYFFQLWSHGVT